MNSSIQFPIGKKKITKYAKFKHLTNSASDLKASRKASKSRKSRTKSFVDQAEEMIREADKSKDTSPDIHKMSKHMRRWSDGSNNPSNPQNNYAKYIKNPGKSKKNSKSKSRFDSQYDTEETQMISSVQVFNPKSKKWFGKKYSWVSDSVGIFSKRSPSITYLKKKKWVNSPIIRSTESLTKQSKSKPKHRKKLTQLYGMNSKNQFGSIRGDDSMSYKLIPDSKSGLKTRITKNSKYMRSKKKYLKVGNFTRQVSARRISTISEDCEVADEPSHHSTVNVRFGIFNNF